MSVLQTDILVIGGGIAGLSFAEHVGRKSSKRIIIVSKGALLETNTRYAQGGIAGVLDQITDSFDKHIADTLKAGDGLCDPQTVATVVKEAPRCIHELITLGARFDTTRTGALSLGLEGGHSAKRIIHNKDHTGLEIQNTLLNAVKRNDQVQQLVGYFAIDLVLNSSGACCGAYLLDPHGKKLCILAAQTVLATGGIGQLYETTTNPKIATGDGIAMASRVGAEIENMAFIQFHPTAIYEPGANPAFLISEAVRGIGAELRNDLSQSFMTDYDQRGSLATRDIVSRAIFREMKLRDVDHVYLDLRQIDQDRLSNEFPTIYTKCAQLGLDLTKDMIPVVPAAHYLCGGVKTDAHGQTSIRGFYCLGESACTGLHGANRLASNSLLEALVFAQQAAKHILNTMPIKSSFTPAKSITEVSQNLDWVALSTKELKSLMTYSVGIVRSRKSLQNALDKVIELNHRTKYSFSKDSLTLRNMLEVAKLIINDSLQWNKNIGGLWFEKDHSQNLK
ncbi:MAG: L-aspartate oxidase [Flavobacteriales bacterium]